MAELVPQPIGRLLSRMLRELDANGSIFDLPVRRFVLGDATRDLSVRFHGQRASSPLGPAAGPQTQLAQNIVLSFLAGGRIFELKTVQILDRLKIPRPCIDMRTVGYNVEWSQELTLEQSLEEYVKATMLVRILVESGRLALAPGFRDVVWDLSVGYDLAGIQNERVQAFMRGMRDATPTIDRLRREIPAGFARYRDLDFATRLSNTLTLSTFHGCPPHEIERIMAWLIESLGLDAIVKLNPTLLGPDETRRIVNDVLGYPDRVPQVAFDRDTKWDQAVAFVGRLGDLAARLGRGFGVKFSNTLVVENDGDFLPASEKEKYLSGPPLHVLAMQLVARFRETFGDRFPISFSGGIDAENVADSIALGLVPVTVCSDLLRPGGYGRMQSYYRRIAERMDRAGARTRDEWVLLGLGEAEGALAHVEASDPRAAASCRAALAAKSDLATAAGRAFFERWLSETKIRNARRYADRLLADTRYRREANAKTPRKLGSKLELFDCVTCDLCVPVCPNDANFTWSLPPVTIPIVHMKPRPGGGFEREDNGVLAIKERHQLATFADACNECGNCDVFCPEDGGPYVVKPRFFGSREEWDRYPGKDGFCFEGDWVYGRLRGASYRLAIEGERAHFAGDGFDVTFALADPEGTLEGSASRAVDLTIARILRWVRDGVERDARVNFLNA
ncbi:MAG: glutamate synthase [Planctomycetes bacterium]|nr:glutamate synthase [Planctomycetota bacterium]MBI3847036.1 glutamate synthase [Planctomycetota bacterium]